MTRRTERPAASAKSKRKGDSECPHCGEVFSRLQDNVIPTHDYPRPCRQVCPGSGESPRTNGATLWNDDPKQREKDFLERAGAELGIIGFAVVKQVAILRGESAGTMDCPLCGMVVRYSLSPFNGHCHVACERDGCIKAME